MKMDNNKSRQILYTEYEYKGKTHRFDLIVCNKQIATICKPIETEDGTFDIEVISKGMNYNEICEYFPPNKKMAKQGFEYNLTALIRGIIYEEFQNTGKGREYGNVRNFWYTHLKFIIEDILKLGETDSVKSIINTAWQDMIISGMVTYEGMNIFSAKENVMHSVIRDSPFSNLIVAAEKEDLFEWYKWIPQLFNCTLIAAGGQPSRAVARAFIKDLKDNNVNLDQQFYMCTISDLDPAGYYIQEAFKAQLEKAIEYYGGSGKIDIRRLFVRKDQITSNLLATQAMKCEDVNAHSEKAKKAEDTKWAYFCKVTNGGLYKEERGKKYRAKLELNAFGKDTIERKIIQELLRIIEETSDESLIMIPEIMRVFDLQRIEAIAKIFKNHRDNWLQPQIDSFLSETEDLQSELASTTSTERRSARKDYEDTVAPIEEKYEDRRESVDRNIDGKIEFQENEIEDYKEQRGFDKTLDWIEEQIEILTNLRDSIEFEIGEDCSIEFEEIKRLERLRRKVKAFLGDKEESEIAPHKESYETILADIRDRDHYRKAELEKYRRWKTTLFNPVEKALERLIERAISKEELDIWYRNLEDDDRTRPHISLLMVHPRKLLENNESAWEQDYPVFKEQDLLQKASKRKDENVGDVRRGFTEDFLNSMKEIILEFGEEIEIDYPEMPEFEDISGELQELHERIEIDIEEGKYRNGEN